MAGTTDGPADLGRIHLCADLPPISGRTRVELEDFLVDERPLYPPSGAGEHLFLRVEKRGIPTHELQRRLAAALGCSAKEIGAAGLKDARAVTRQWLSVPARGEAGLDHLEDPAITVLERSRHETKLGKGHLAANHFRIRIRDCAEGDLARAGAILDRLLERGVPNAFGLQRFGKRRNSHRLGHALILGDRERFLAELLGHADGDGRFARAAEAFRAGELEVARKTWPKSCVPERAALRSLIDHPADRDRAVRAIPKKFRLLYASALQSLVFNRYATARLAIPELVLPGEVLTFTARGASFVVEDAAREADRCRAGELVPSGPMVGRKLLRPAAGSRPRELEDAALAQSELTLEAVAGHSLRVASRRRALWTPLADVELAEELEPRADEPPGRHLRIAFTLPRGAYATGVLEELLRRAVD